MHDHDTNWAAGGVRVRASGPDPFGGARGHDYIAHRNLGRLQSYRCRLGAAQHPYAGLPELDETVQLKAMDATDAMRRAHHVTGRPVIDAERLDTVAA